MPVSAPSTPDAEGDPTPTRSPERRTFLQVARQPRMIGLLLVFVLAALVCGRLGAWQLDRAYERAELAAQQEAAEAVAAGPSWLGDVLAPQESFPGELVGREVRVAGEFEDSGSLLVPGRVLEGHTGYLVLTPFRVTDDGTGGDSWADLSGAPVLAVVQGWVAAPADADALILPEGEVTLTGWLQMGESTSGSAAVVDGRTEQIALSALVNEWGGPIYTGYLVANGGPGSPEERGSRGTAPTDHRRRFGRQPAERLLRAAVVGVRRVRRAPVGPAGARRDGRRTPGRRAHRRRHGHRGPAVGVALSGPGSPASGRPPAPGSGGASPR